MVEKQWSAERAKRLYNVLNWSAGYFDVADSGDMQITVDGFPSVGIPAVIEGIRERGLDMPVLLRVGDILDARIKLLHESFSEAIASSGYEAPYRGVYPIKVNQQKHVVEHVAKFAKTYHHGLEAGSKPELLAAISFLDDPDAYLICNGYKDAEFIDLGLYARKIGINCIFVVEMPGELDLILDRSAELGVEPSIGLRVKLSARNTGKWAESGGDRSVFGLNITQVTELVDSLRARGKLDTLQLLHYHIGSQIPNIRDIRTGVQEACRVYAGLVGEGAPMGILDLGGGLAVDYDGSHTNSASSRNYTLEEYCADIVDTIVQMLDGTGVPHPALVTESGRATVAYYSVLLFNVLDTARFDPQPVPSILEDAPDVLLNMQAVLDDMERRNVQECYNDAVFYRDELGEHFRHGRLSLRQRAIGETLFWNILAQINTLTRKLKFVPEDLVGLDSLLSDIYYGNFSLFQSLPDVWAIDQLFPIMPVHRLNERPTRVAILSDITCDCDGKIDTFIDLHEERRSLPVHELRENEEYYMGVFLVGAYQETLGDLHNLLGDTNVVTIRLSHTHGFEFEGELEGDSVEDVLSYVEYDPKELVHRMRKVAERAVGRGQITAQERRRIMEAYTAGLRGYTYFER